MTEVKMRMLISKVNKRIDNADYCLGELRNFCYSDDSNEHFDELHDDLWAQEQGFNETVQEWKEDLINNSIDERTLMAYDKELKQVEEMIKSIENYLDATQLLVDNKIYWIFC